MDTDLQDINQRLSVAVQEEKYENDQSDLQNVGQYSQKQCSETAALNIKVEIDDDDEYDTGNGYSHLQYLDDQHPDSNVHVENNGRNIDSCHLKSENVDLSIENKGFIIIDNSNVKYEKSQSDDNGPNSNICDSNLKSENADLKTEHFDSGFDPMHCKNEQTDSHIDDRIDTGVVDPHPMLLIKHLADQGFSVTQNDVSGPEESSPSTSYMKEEMCTEDSNEAISGELAKPAKIETDTRRHICPECNQEFDSWIFLCKHVVGKSTTKCRRLPFTCDQCDRQFQNSSLLQIHLLTHTEDRPHKCKICEKGFKTVYNLKNHMIAHKTERPFQCNVCDKVFKNQIHLTKHTISHSTERPHPCNLCDKAFKRPQDLRKHMVSHSTERPHACSICTSTFKTEYVLKTHMAYHSAERPFKCDLCDHIGFKTVFNLRAHEVSRHNNLTHQCFMCKEAFKSAPHLKTHMTTQHSAQGTDTS